MLRRPDVSISSSPDALCSSFHNGASSRICICGLQPPIGRGALKPLLFTSTQHECLFILSRAESTYRLTLHMHGLTLVLDCCVGSLS